MRNYDRPNLIGDPHSGNCPNGAKVGTALRWFNPSAFSIPDGTFGNFGVGVLRDQTFYNADFSLIKNFRFHESKNIQIRAEVFNVFNCQILGTPSATIGSGTPGVISSIASTPRDCNSERSSVSRVWFEFSGALYGTAVLHPHRRAGWRVAGIFFIRTKT